jgi:hypothetical protein
MNRHTSFTAKVTSPVLGNTAAPALVPANAGAATPIGANAVVAASDRPTGEAGAPNLSTRPTCPDCGKVIYQCIGHSDFDDDEMMPASEVREIMDEWFDRVPPLPAGWSRIEL